MEAIEVDPGTYATVNLNGTFFERLVGCYLVLTMPDKGLQEALESLADMKEFYKTQPQHLALPGPKTVFASGVLAERNDRPELIISE